MYWFTFAYTIVNDKREYFYLFLLLLLVFYLFKIHFFLGLCDRGDVTLCVFFHRHLDEESLMFLVYLFKVINS